jgi:hypothetical protein
MFAEDLDKTFSIQVLKPEREIKTALLTQTLLTRKLKFIMIYVHQKQ